MTEVPQYNEWADNKSIPQGRKTWFKALWKKIKEGAHKIWDDINSPQEWSYYNAYKDKPDKLTISHTSFYDSQELESIKETIRHYYDSLKWDEKPDWEPFFYTMVARGRIQTGGLLKPPYICVVDFSKPNTQNRLFVINLKTLEVENAICVWHWKKSWEWGEATQFSNEKWSMKSSLGAFLTQGKLKYNSKWTRKWLRLQWWEDSNYRAGARWIYMHPAGVNQSEWCFTIPYKEDKQEVYDILKKIEWRTLVYSYYSEDFVKDSWITNPNEKNVGKMNKAELHFLWEGAKSIVSGAKSMITKVLSWRDKDNQKNN